VHFRIRGPARLSGRFRPAGNKNAALPVLAGSLLADAPVTLHNVSEIRDVLTLIELIESLGATSERLGPGSFRIDPSGLESRPLEAGLSQRIRASILLAGPLLARFGEVVLPPPGGDVIGRRRLDTHFLALGRLGAEVEASDRYELRASRLRGADIFLDEPSVTGTENAVLAAVTADGETRIRNAACEPHVQDLCAFLSMLGADIVGAGTSRLTIRGVDRLGVRNLFISPFRRFVS
jgi:UDP-N-acetylglucosamine 1-carboxyvinyltransferase